MNMVKIKWTDSAMSLLADRWQDKEDLIELTNNLDTTAETVGFVLYENEKHICLVQTHLDEQCRGGYIILKSNIIERKEIDV